eukprot:TRINITY_DN1660_c0_g1_i3.p1 TRINITY_DN1660_c0_g1~~TRINITY_DN1660_c0_g1_i3.p1  ORF type:complete len:249 (+),score=54.56 TRINITY_DN1660_c0_g1_i3:33-749(+)
MGAKSTKSKTSYSTTSSSYSSSLFNTVGSVSKKATGDAQSNIVFLTSGRYGYTQEMTNISLKDLEKVDLGAMVDQAKQVAPSGGDLVFPDAGFMMRGGPPALWRNHFRAVGTHGLVFAVDKFEDLELIQAGYVVTSSVSAAIREKSSNANLPVLVYMHNMPANLDVNEVWKKMFTSPSHDDATNKKQFDAAEALNYCLQASTDPVDDGLREGLSWLTNTIAGREVVSAFNGPAMALSN